MGNYQYEIKVTNQVNVTNKTISNKSFQSSKETISSNNKEMDKNEKKDGIGDAVSAQFLLSSVQKISNSIQNEKIQQLNKTVGTAAKYGTMIYTAAKSSNWVVLIITTIVDILSEVIKSSQTQAMKDASMANSVDEARYNAGILDLSGVSVSQNWWSSRYEYNR